MKKLGYSILLLFLIGCESSQERENEKALLTEYHTALKEAENEYINNFYASRYEGIISSINEYNKSPYEYVFSIRDSLNNNKTIGKVEIMNFTKALEGDSIYKEANTFQIKYQTKEGWETATIKFHQE